MFLNRPVAGALAVVRVVVMATVASASCASVVAWIALRACIIAVVGIAVFACALSVVTDIDVSVSIVGAVRLLL